MSITARGFRTGRRGFSVNRILRGNPVKEHGRSYRSCPYTISTWALRGTYTAGSRSFLSQAVYIRMKKGFFPKSTKGKMFWKDSRP